MREERGQPVIDPGDLGAEVTRFRAQIDRLRSDHPGSLQSEELFAELETAHEELLVAEEELRTQQEELERLVRLHRTERWLRDRVVAMLPVAVLVSDGSGVIQTANAAAASLFARTVDDITGKPVFTLVDPTDRAGLRRLLGRSVSAGSDFRALVRCSPRAQEPLRVEVTATVLQRSQPSATRVNWVCLPAEARPGWLSADEGLLGECLVDLAQRGLATTDVPTLVQQAARMCHRAFPVQTWTSISMGSPSEPQLLASDSSHAQEADGAQLMVGAGPMLDAWRTGATVSAADLHGDGRWPQLARQLGPTPVVSAVALPLVADQERLGVLSLYSDDAALAGARLVRDAELLATTLAAVLQEADAKAGLARVADQLREAMRSRAGIEQAKGIVMAARHCTPDEAFTILAEMSSAAGIKLRDLARSIVEQQRHED